MNSRVPDDESGGEGRVWTPLELAEVKTPRRIGSIWQAKEASSRRRLKFEGRATCYHVMSRTVNGEFLFGPTEKEAFRRMMWRRAAFSGVEVLTYMVMDNHFTRWRRFRIGRSGYASLKVTKGRGGFLSIWRPFIRRSSWRS
jgi:hypothetical protein